jgi:hypothetical protein
MRFETLYASQYLVRRLQYAHAVTHVRDEGDIIMLRLKQGVEVMILMVERGINLSDVQYHYRTNAKRGIYTLMLLWVDMFIASDGTTIHMPDWMAALDSLHEGKLYGFESQGRDAYFFPVYLEGSGRERTVRYGNVVNYAHIGGRVVDSQSPPLRGTWRIADFDVNGRAYNDDQSIYNRYRHGSPLAVYYAMLGLDDGTDLNRVKATYRALARQHHPDLNPSADTHQQMARINDAYQRIAQHIATQDDS